MLLNVILACKFCTADLFVYLNLMLSTYIFNGEK